MTERCVSFTAELVELILRGEKTESRRPLKPAPDPVIDGFRLEGRRLFPWVLDGDDVVDCAPSLPSPFGAPGDVLLVGEALSRVDDGNGYPYAIYKRGGETVLDEFGIPLRWKWKVDTLSGRYCPKELRRIRLTVKRVWVERLQDITDDGALREGCTGHPVYGHAGYPDGYHPRDEFADLWDSIYPPPFAWDSNPWTAGASFTLQKGVSS